jgi:hypothetical protein
VDGDPLQPAPSELLLSQVPNHVLSGQTVYTFTDYPGTYYRFFNCAGRTPQGAGNGTIISSIDTGCGHPGTRIARFRITNSVPFRINSTCKHIWSYNVGSDRNNTIVQAYVPSGTGPAVNLSDSANNFNYDDANTCLIQPYGLILNPYHISVPEINSSANLAVIFPQPANGEVMIRLKHSTHTIHRFNVYDLQGKLVKNYSFSGDQYSFEVGNLSGLYFIDFPEENIHSKLVVD